MRYAAAAAVRIVEQRGHYFTPEDFARWEGGASLSADDMKPLLPPMCDTTVFLLPIGPTPAASTSAIPALPRTAGPAT